MGCVVPNLTKFGISKIFGGFASASLALILILGAGSAWAQDSVTTSTAQPVEKNMRSPQSLPREVKTEHWLGHQVVLGSRDLPVLGEIETRTEIFIIAKVQRDGDRIIIDQRACRFKIAPVLGVHASLTEQAVSHLPPTRVVFQRADDGDLVAIPWTVSWGEEDIDLDKNPGSTVRVDSSLCSGELFIASTVKTHARVHFSGDSLQGRIWLNNKERILGASSWCLSAAAQDKEEQQSGWIRYQRVTKNLSCASLKGQAWPVKVKIPKSQGIAAKDSP